MSSLLGLYHSAFWVALHFFWYSALGVSGSHEAKVSSIFARQVSEISRAFVECVIFKSNVIFLSASVSSMDTAFPFG